MIMKFFFNFECGWLWLGFNISLITLQVNLLLWPVKECVSWLRLVASYPSLLLFWSKLKACIFLGYEDIKLRIYVLTLHCESSTIFYAVLVLV